MTDIKDVEKAIRSAKAKIKRLQTELQAHENERMRLKTGWMVGDTAVWHVKNDIQYGTGAIPCRISRAGIWSSYVEITFQRLADNYERRAQVLPHELSRPIP